jgi:hypothetical protein
MLKAINITKADIRKIMPEKAYITILPISLKNARRYFVAIIFVVFEGTIS